MKLAAWACAGLVLTLGAFGAAEEPDLGGLVQGNTAFALDLYAKLDREGNLFMSPHSMSSALAMTLAGARGETATEMEQVLHFDLGQEGTQRGFAALQARLEAVQESGAVKLAVANALWPQQGYSLLPEYLETVKVAYDAMITPLDFAGDTEGARQTINGWVEEKTKDKIRDLIGRGGLDPLTRLVLVNAIYFKGDWAHAFKPGDTTMADFFTAADKTVPVPLMVQSRRFPYAEFDDCQVVKLPYVGNELAMLVVLPRAKEGLAVLEAELTPARLAEWRDTLAVRDVRVFLPKFKLTWGATALNGPLTALGMKTAFSDTRADFSGMDGRLHWLYIGAVLHKAFVEVNEEGTEAAAATAVVIKARSMPQRPKEFRADHPFLFLIQEEQTGAILFMGRLADPLAAE